MTFIKFLLGLAALVGGGLTIRNYFVIGRSAPDWAKPLANATAFSIVGFTILALATSGKDIKNSIGELCSISLIHPYCMSEVDRRRIGEEESRRIAHAEHQRQLAVAADELARRREAEAATARKRETEELVRKREAEVAAANKREAEELVRKREAEAAAVKKREAQEFARRRDADAAAARRREAEAGPRRSPGASPAQIKSAWDAAAREELSRRDGQIDEVWTPEATHNMKSKWWDRMPFSMENVRKLVPGARKGGWIEPMFVDLGPADIRLRQGDASFWNGAGACAKDCMKHRDCVLAHHFKNISNGYRCILYRVFPRISRVRIFNQLSASARDARIWVKP